MRRWASPHAHPCQVCGAKTPCTGDVTQNYDGTPDWICSDFHLEDGTLNPHFLCSMCFEAQLDVEEAKTDALIVAMAAVLNVPVTALSHSHYVDWDAIGKRTVRALCGTFIRRTEHAAVPSCPTCARELAARSDGLTADDVFGPAPVGTQVKVLDFNPTADYKERTR